jgi:Ca2+-binding RTX toxin-like protein
MLSSRLVRLIVPAVLILILSSAVFAFTATNLVAPSSASDESHIVNANEMKPPECDALNLTTVVVNGNGTNGNDLILGTAGNNALQGKKGDDCIVGGDGDDHLRGGQGDDILLGGPGDDRIDGGQGYDECYGQDGNDTIDGKDCEVSD